MPYLETQRLIDKEREGLNRQTKPGREQWVKNKIKLDLLFHRLPFSLNVFPGHCGKDKSMHVNHHPWFQLKCFKFLTKIRNLL